MPKWIRPSRVRLAVIALNEWRESAKSQAAMHLWPLLSVIRAGARPNQTLEIEEASDFSFWDRHFRVPGDIRSHRDSDGEFTDNFYIDPLVRQKKPSDHPHRGPATIRKRTFVNSWQAARHDELSHEFTLAPNFAQTFEDRVLKRANVSYKIPVIDLAVWLYRDEGFENNDDASTLEQRFRDDFKFDDRDYQRLFRFSTESADRIFTNTQPSNDEKNAEIDAALLSSGDVILAPPPPLFSAEASEPSLPDDDPNLIKVLALIEIGTSGILLKGVPGTSKTWYAKQLAHKIATDPGRVFTIQFHPSYGYEDLVEGYRPDDSATSGFVIVPKLFRDACEVAISDPGSTVVFIIDEINRGDPARVFGELLTYIEHGYRGQSFRLPFSGDQMTVPPNILIIGTMNPYDRSIAQFDLALMRRFDHIELTPSAEVAEQFLAASGNFTRAQVERIVR